MKQKQPRTATPMEYIKKVKKLADLLKEKYGIDYDLATGELEIHLSDDLRISIPVVCNVTINEVN
jgi:hypothetical protein